MKNRVEAAVIHVEPEKPQVETYKTADLERLAATKGLSVLRDSVDGALVFHITDAAGRVLFSSTDKVHTAYFLQDKIPQGLTADDLKAAARQRNLQLGKRLLPLRRSPMYFVADPRNGDILMYGNDPASLWIHLQNTPAYPA